MMNRPKRILRNLFAGLLLLVGLALLLGWWIVRRSLPQLDGSVTIAGLAQPVTIDRDQWGRPWIRANSIEDAVTAQGYVMAQDRLWQMDLLRRAAAGDLSEIFGGVALKFDEDCRTLGMRQAAERAAADASPEIRSLLEAYARGVNENIAQRAKNLPLEFAVLGYKPRPWTPADTYLISLYMYRTLTSTWQQKLNRQWIIAKVGPDRAHDLFVEDSPLDHPIWTAPSPSSPPRPGSRTGDGPPLGAKHAAGNEPPFAPIVWDSAREFLAQFDEQTRQIIGSNNFVVSGAHTASGKPLLANDTHLQLSVPALWYVIHLTAPGLNVQGFALPGAPLVIIGHNDRIAWGFTNSNVDVEDLYIESFDSANPLFYRANGKQLTAEVRHETIHVRAKPDVNLDVIVTRHGPIVHRDPPEQGGRAYAFRWTALEPGGLDFGFPLLGEAQNWHDFIETTRHIAGPGQNTIYADVDGNIGFTIPAHMPIRASGNGALPVPGDTDEFEWKGYIPFEELPRVLNPPDGIIATANARTVGPGYKYYLTDRQAGPYRTARLYELLSNRTGLTPADCNAIQNDIVSLPNRFLAGALVKAANVKPPHDPRAQQLIAKLQGWDARATADSVETSFVEYTRHALFRHLLAPYLGDEVTKYELWEPQSVYNDVWWRDKVFLENVLHERPATWLPNTFASYDELLVASADDAVSALQKQTGSSDEASWTWGRLHPLDMVHPLGRAGLLHRFLSIGPYPQGGTVDTVRAMGVGHGPAMRFVADLSNFDQSLMEVPTGESGQYASPYYRDQFPEWFAGRGIAAPFSDAAETRVRAHSLTLLPARGDTSGSAALLQ
ncbi:MAG: penicillin acylase family protein [Candidatus Acidiferrales bacterium]